MTITAAGAENRRHALGLAVQHHGMANHTANAIPANVETVITTAAMFADFLGSGRVPERTSRRTA